MIINMFQWHKLTFPVETGKELSMEIAEAACSQCCPFRIVTQLCACIVNVAAGDQHEWRWKETVMIKSNWFTFDIGARQPWGDPTGINRPSFYKWVCILGRTGAMHIITIISDVQLILTSNMCELMFIQHIWGIFSLLSFARDLAKSGFVFHFE